MSYNNPESAHLYFETTRCISTATAAVISTTGTVYQRPQHLMTIILHGTALRAPWCFAPVLVHQSFVRSASMHTHWIQINRHCQLTIRLLVPHDGVRLLNSASALISAHQYSFIPTRLLRFLFVRCASQSSLSSRVLCVFSQKALPSSFDPIPRRALPFAESAPLIRHAQDWIFARHPFKHTHILQPRIGPSSLCYSRP